MGKFIIEGGHKLSGTITPQGAKNEALEVISAVLLTSEPVTITNIPEILDVKNLIELLANMGVKVERHGKGHYTFQADAVDTSYIETEEFVAKCAKLRGSVMVVGPLLSRFGHSWFPKPGGDKIGRRRVDTHLDGMCNLGAQMEYAPTRRAFHLTSDGRLTGRYMLLEEASVTGTANIVMAAVLARGTTTIYNAACEPYVQQLCKMLNRMGAFIDGVGSNLLRVHGVEKLGGTEPTEIATLSALAIAGITLTPTFDAETTSYTGSTSDESSVVTATAAEGVTVTATHNGTAADLTSAITWVTGSNLLAITAAKEGAESTTYSVVITKETV